MRFHTPPHLLANSINVTLVGVGGTGGYLLSHLAQMNYLLRNLSNGQSSLNVTVYDPDIVTEWNIGRQNFFPCDRGQNKALVLASRVNTWFGTQWTAIPESYNGNSTHEVDFLMTCLDSAKTRCEIAKEAMSKKSEWKLQNTLWIDGGNDVDSGQVILGHLHPKGGGENHLPNVYELYGSKMESIEDDPTESCSHSDSLSRQDYGVNHQTALLMAQLLWQLVRHGGVEFHGNFFSLPDGSIDSLIPDPVVWKSFGYSI